MPDTLSREELATIRKQLAGRQTRTIERRMLAHLDALTAAVEGLTLYDENARTMADAAESMRNRVLAILRGEQ